MRIFFAVSSGVMILVTGTNSMKSQGKFSEEQLVIIRSVILGVNFIFFIANNTVLV